MANLNVRMGLVSLKIADLERIAGYYQTIVGLRERTVANGSVELGTPTQALVILLEVFAHSLDLHRLMAEAPQKPWHGLSDDTYMGHIHLKIADLQVAEHFYHQALGLDVNWWMPIPLYRWHKRSVMHAIG